MHGHKGYMDEGCMNGDTRDGCMHGCLGTGMTDVWLGGSLFIPFSVELWLKTLYCIGNFSDQSDAKEG